MSKDILFELSWATFCKRAIVDADTNLISLIDITPSIQLDKSLPNGLPDVIPIQLGDFSAVFFFCKKQDQLLTAISETLSVYIQLADVKKSPTGQLELSIDENEDSTFFIVNIENLVIPATIKEGQFFNEILVIVKLEEFEIARLTLPVKINFLRSQDENKT